MGFPEGDCNCVDIAGRASERGLGSSVGEGGGDAVRVVVYL